MPVTRLPLGPRPIPAFFLGGGFRLWLDCFASLVTKVCQLHAYRELKLGSPMALTVADAVKLTKTPKHPPQPTGNR